MIKQLVISKTVHLVSRSQKPTTTLLLVKNKSKYQQQEPCSRWRRLKFIFLVCNFHRVKLQLVELSIYLFLLRLERFFPWPPRVVISSLRFEYYTMTAWSSSVPGWNSMLFCNLKLDLATQYYYIEFNHFLCLYYNSYSVAVAHCEVVHSVWFIRNVVKLRLVRFLAIMLMLL